MSVWGSAETVNQVDLLNLIHASGHAGTLKLLAGERATKLHFYQGQIYLPTGGSRGAFKIGALLVKAGKLSGRDLLRALQIQKAEDHRERLGDLLVRHGLVRREDLDAVIRAQFEEEICDLLFEENAEYEFKKDVLPAGFADDRGNIQALGFDIRSILMEASRRQDEWRRIRADLPSGRSVLCIARATSGSWQVTQGGGGAAQAGADGPGEREAGEAEAEVVRRWRAVHALFETNPFAGTRTVDEIVASSGISAFAASAVVAELHREGLVRALTREELEAGVREHLEAGRTPQAYKLFEWANHSDRLRPTASRLDQVLLRPEHLVGNSFAMRTSSVRALQVLSRLLRRGASFHYTCREGESAVEVFFSPAMLRLHLSGPRRTHSTTRYLRRRKAITSAALDRARETARLERRSLDRVLLEDGHVDREQWVRAVKDKAVSGMFSIFGWSEPHLEVEGGVVAPPPPEDVAGLVCEIPLSDGLRESLRRDLLRWKLLLRAIPTPDAICICARPSPPERPRRAYDLFDGRRTVGDMIQLARVAPLELVRFVYDAVHAEHVRPLSDREHYERSERARAQGRPEEAVVYCKSAIAWGHAPRLYGQRLGELRQGLRDSPNTESRPVLHGDVGTFSLAEVLQLLHQGKRSGTLKVRDGEREQVVYLDGGDLYVLKLEHSESDQEVWDLLLGEETRTGLDLGGLLKRRGLIDQSELSAAELQSVKDDLLECFLWEGARFEFVQNLLPSELREDSARATKLKLNTTMLLMDAMARLAEWDELRAVLRSSRAVFRYADQAAQLEAVRGDAGHAAYLFDGKHSLAEVVRISGEKRFRLYRAASALVERGALVFRGVKPRAGPVKVPATLASGRLPRLTHQVTLPARRLERDLATSDELDSGPGLKAADLRDSMEG